MTQKLIIFFLTLSYVVRLLLKLLARNLSKGKAMLDLFSSFIKYIAVIAMLFFILSVWGVDTATLLAGIGILSLVVGLGAQPLIEDIIAGLFIVFENVFEVGDIIVVDGFRGTVKEIGIRTTQIEDAGGDIKVVNNSDIRTLVNMTSQLSLAISEVDIEYSESLERVENILETEFPNIRRRLPAILDGPFYKGVVSLADNSVTIRVIVQCAESSRAQLERDMRREMKLIFDEYEINIPYPQVVVHEPREFYKATLAEQLRADRFNDEQKEAAKDMGNEEYEADDNRK